MCKWLQDTYMINTYNETALHRSLKTLYLIQQEGSIAEFNTGHYIADILRPDGSVVEIQTGSISHLKPKLTEFLAQKRNVTIVYPVVTVKYIETLHTDLKVSRKKSPKKLNIYDIFRELTGIAPLLTDRHLRLEAIEVTATEERRQTDLPVQTQNGRRRFRKNWVKTGKRLDSAGTVHVFKTKKDWMKLLPRTDCFTVKECTQLLLQEGIKVRQDQVSVMLWVYTHAGFLSRTKTGRAYLYHKQ